MWCLLYSPPPSLPADSCGSPVADGAARRRATSEARVSGGGKKFTWEELAEHNSRDDALISVRGKVRADCN